MPVLGYDWLAFFRVDETVDMPPVLAQSSHIVTVNSPFSTPDNLLTITAEDDSAVERNPSTLDGQPASHLSKSSKHGYNQASRTSRSPTSQSERTVSRVRRIWDI